MAAAEIGLLALIGRLHQARLSGQRRVTQGLPIGLKLQVDLIGLEVGRVVLGRCPGGHARISVHLDELRALIVVGEMNDQLVGGQCLVRLHEPRVLAKVHELVWTRHADALGAGLERALALPIRRAGHVGVVEQPEHVALTVVGGTHARALHPVAMECQFARDGRQALHVVVRGLFGLDLEAIARLRADVAEKMDQSRFVTRHRFALALGGVRPDIEGRPVIARAREVRAAEPRAPVVVRGRDIGHDLQVLLARVDVGSEIEHAGLLGRDLRVGQRGGHRGRRRPLAGIERNRDRAPHADEGDQRREPGAATSCDQPPRARARRRRRARSSARLDIRPGRASTPVRGPRDSRSGTRRDPPRARPWPTTSGRPA